MAAPRGITGAFSARPILLVGESLGFPDSPPRWPQSSCTWLLLWRSLQSLRGTNNPFPGKVRIGFNIIWSNNGNIRFVYLHSVRHQFLDSLVVRISACHVEGPGSIPGRGVSLLSCKYSHRYTKKYLYFCLPLTARQAARVAQSVER